MISYGFHMETTTKPQPFVGARPLAKRWGIDHKTVLAGINRGDIPCTKIGGRWLIPMAWVEAQEAADVNQSEEVSA